MKLQYCDVNNCTYDSRKTNNGPEMNLVTGIPHSVIPLCSDTYIPAAAIKMIKAQPKVERDKAPFGPYLSNTCPYEINNNRDTGLTKAMAKGKAPGELGYPVDFEVKRATVMGLAKEYPK